MSTQWVQSIYSDKGEKWKVELEGFDAWVSLTDARNQVRLPKSEYRLCDPPEVWLDVTNDCRVVSRAKGTLLSLYHGQTEVTNDNGYRISKMQCQLGSLPRYGFIVERREAQP